MPVLTYPTPLATFFGGLRVQSGDLRLTGGTQENATGGGEVIIASLGVRLWEADITLIAADDPGGVEAVLTALQVPGRTFFADARKRPCPIKDPTGSILGAANPVIASLPAGGLSLTLSGLPAGYVLSAGDYISFTRGSPLRHEMHQIVTDAVASGGGVSPEFEVVPGIRPGVIVGAAVVLVRPFFRAVMVAGSLKFSPYTRGPRQGASFTFRQTLAKASA